MNAFISDREFLGEFIDRVRELPALWETKNPIHRKKGVRKAALETLLPFVQTKVPTATTKQVDSKIGSLRGTYRTERFRVLASQRSGAAAADVYVPNLWYYSRMSFLNDHLEARPSLSSLPPRLPCSQPEPSLEQEEAAILEEPDLDIWSQDDISQEEGLESVRQEVAVPTVSQEEAGPTVSQEVAGPSGTQEVAGPSSRTRSQVPPIRLTRRTRRERSTSQAAMALIREAHATLQEPTTTEEAYAGLVGAKFQSMSMEQRLLCEPLLLSLLNKRVMGRITPNTAICEVAQLT